MRLQLNGILSDEGIKRRKRTPKEIAKIEAYNNKQRTLKKQIAQNLQPFDVDEENDVQ
ncbi:MAG: hypothetical protein OSJ68_08140 [Clostridia bacterium]|nr:hypothetical protein [Clostridia bacterium]